MLSIDTRYVRHITRAEPEEVPAAFRARDLEVTQVTAGAWSTEFVNVLLEDVTVTTGFTDAAYLMRGGGATSLVTILAPRIPLPSSLRNGIQLCQDSVGILGAGTEVCISEVKGQLSGAITISEAVYSGYCRSLLGREGAQFHGRLQMLQTTPALFDNLRALMEELTGAARRDPTLFDVPEVRSAASRALVTAAVLATRGTIEGRSRNEPLAARMLYVHRAQEFLEADATRPVNLDEMCGAAGVSERTLRYAFKEICGLSPARYLRLRALQAVRHELLDPAPETTVTSAAFNQGFWTLGRFAGEYYSLFGEKPSATLRRGMAGRGIAALRLAEISEPHN